MSVMNVGCPLTTPVDEEKMWHFLASQIVNQASKCGYFIPEEQCQNSVVFKKSGRLVIVGSGIISAGQFTTEAISHIKNADKVLFFGSDPVTETYIRDLFPGVLDLGVFFDGSKDRYDSCVQMAEACLFSARQGLYTVAIFPGHPGIFSIPSLRAIQIARKQGITADILPGILHEDSLFSDLAIDPYYHGGCQTLGATDFLLFNRQLLTDSHVVMRHVGSIGEQSFSTTGVGLTNLSILLKQLQKVYGPDYGVVHNYPSQYPTCKPFMDRRPLSDFLKPEVLKTFVPFSTLYLPPMKTIAINPDITSTTSSDLWKRRSGVVTLLIGSRGDSCSCWTADWLETNPLKNPKKLMKKYAITPAEISSLTSSVPQNVLLAVKPYSCTVALAVVRRLCLDPSFACAYSKAANSFYSTYNAGGGVVYNGILRFMETSVNTFVGKVWKLNEMEPLVDNIRGEFIPSFEGSWKDLECVMGVGVATILRVRSLLKFWRAHSQISTGVQQQSSLLPVVVEDIEKTTVHLTSFEALLVKMNPDYKPVVLDDTELMRLGWPNSLTPAITGSLNSCSVFLPHVSTLIV
ncbi:hypothetical protein EMCRGX_G024407 [Ephydatia muelleri]